MHTSAFSILYSVQITLNNRYWDTSDERRRISQVLDDLAQVDSSLSQIVDLKFFCGFSFHEIAVMLGVSERTAQRKWEKARIYLHRSLRSDLPL